MIRSLTIEGFKRFARLEMEVAPLTVLAGLNGAGKTSVLHALLLAHEARNGATVRLNGPFGLELGTAGDVRNWATGDALAVTVADDEGSACWSFGVPSDDALYLTVERAPERLPRGFGGVPRAFTYLCAERLGPRAVLGSSALPPVDLEIGLRGEFSAQILATLGGRPVPDSERLHPTRDSSAAPLLKYEVERWLSEIARPVEIDAERFPGTGVTALRFRSPGGDWVRAPNMGFGVTYSLPLVLGGLVAAPGGLLIVENPEAHLHPAGQSRVGVFLAWLAERGVQVVVETHSDHVLNGVRRAIGEHGYLASSDALVQFFEGTGAVAGCSALRFTRLGGISDWPPGFFDQYQVDVAALGRVRRQR